ncbi:MAG: hypothetical protein GF399_04345 [Candidatus Coatesbacteria bacterium]|nr:hypothetical protein [Candidatus Coatesbacteria bacterium]
MRRPPLLLLLLLSVPLSAAEPISLAVTDFEPLGVFPDQARAVAEIIRTELVGLPGIQVIERARLAVLLEERSLSMSGLTTEQAAELGELTGADYVAVGSVAALGSTYTVSLRLVEVATSEAVLGETQTVGDAEELPWACRSLAVTLAKATGSEAAEVEVPVSGGAPPRAQSLKFYRRGEYDEPRSAFAAAETDLVVWALELLREETALPQTHEVKVQWIDPAGESRWSEVRAAEFAAGQAARRVIGGKGYTETGAWETGVWTLRTLVDGQLALTRTFTID